jgi:hypothetical protein
MGLNNTNTIDLITKPFPGDDCKLVLFVVDDGSITDERQRYKLLVSKLTNYVNFVSSEDFRREHPGIDHADVLIRVICTTPPNEAMLNIQAVGKKNDGAQRPRVLFVDRASFLADSKP